MESGEREGRAEEKGEEGGGKGEGRTWRGRGKEGRLKNRSNFPSWLRLTNSLGNESSPSYTQLRGHSHTLRFCEVPFLGKDKTSALCSERKRKGKHITLPFLFFRLAVSLCPSVNRCPSGQGHLTLLQRLPAPGSTSPQGMGPREGLGRPQNSDGRREIEWACTWPAQLCSSPRSRGPNPCPSHLFGVPPSLGGSGPSDGPRPHIVIRTSGRF